MFEDRNEKIEGEITPEMFNNKLKLFVIAKDDKSFEKLKEYCISARYGFAVFNTEPVFVADIESDGYQGVIFGSPEKKVLERISSNIIRDFVMYKILENINIYQPFMVE